MYIKCCCVPGCTDKVSSRHRFPDPKTARYKKWLDVINNEELYSLEHDAIHRNKRVCRRHFEKKFYSEGAARLHLNAIPTLYLPSMVIQAETSTVKEVLQEPSIENTEENTIEEVLQEPNISVDTDQSSRTRLLKRKHEGKGDFTPHKLLKKAGINIKENLSPKEEKLYVLLKNVTRKCKRMKVSKQDFKLRLQEAEKLSCKRIIEDNISGLNKIACQFITGQIREAGKSPKQHRFTVDEKIMSLALFKQSPSAYRFLAKIFTLPSKSTLNIFLKNINFDAGLNDSIFESLKNATAKLDPSDKYVSLIWDEMSIMPSLTFQENKGYIEGFEDMGQNDRQSELADHVLVFIVPGLKKKFKQPISYTFLSRGGAKSYQIKKLVNSILIKLLEIDLKPIFTICDQAATNVAILNSLLEETKVAYLKQRKEYRGGYFEINDFQIYPIFDPPHLLKGIRNNFIDKSVKFGPQNNRKEAKWEHIQNLYENDNAPNIIDGLRALPHLTDEHIYKRKIKKMKVKYAAQIFSQRLASTLSLTSKIDVHNVLGEGTGNTAELLFFFDRLFDSVNGSIKLPVQGKTLRCGINDESDHIRFWKEEALPMLSSMEFVTYEKKEKKKPPSLRNWIFTLKNIISVWNILKHKGFKYLLGRHLNQDPLENMFGQIRSYGIRYNNPTASAFVGIFKTIIVNGTINIYNPTFNCENDICNILFDGLKFLFENTKMRGKQKELDTNNSVENICQLQQPISVGNIAQQFLQLELSQLVNNYVAGFILKTIKKRILPCLICTNTLFTNEIQQNNALISSREYLGGWHKRLCYPTSKFAECFFFINSLIKCNLKQRAYDKNMLQVLKYEISERVDFSFLNCSDHKSQIVSFIINISCRTLIHAWCKDVNRILMGKDTRSYYGDDLVKKKAYVLFSKRKKR